MTRSKTLRKVAAAIVAVATLVTAKATNATEQQRPSRGVTNIVLVHGAWADGSSWSKVIPLLEARVFTLMRCSCRSHHSRTTLPPCKERSRA